MGRLIRFWVLWLVQCHLITAAVLIIMGGSGGGYAWVGELEQYCWRELPPPIAGFAAPLLVPFAYAVEVQVPISAPPGWGSLIAQEEIPIAPIAALVFLPVLLMPMWTVLLDTTFRMARVRRLHLLRGIAYSLPGAVAAFVVLLAFFIVWTRVYRPVTWNQPQWLAATLGLAYLAYHVAWWQRFVARYLRLRHANAVVAVHFFMTSIVLVAVWAIMYSWEIV